MAKRAQNEEEIHAEVNVPSLDDWEKEWEKNPQRSLNFQTKGALPVVSPARAN